MRSARRLLAVDRDIECCDEARLIVVEMQLTLMQVRDRLDERETKPRALVRATGVKPTEALQRFLTASERNARAAIRDCNSDSLSLRVRP